MDKILEINELIKTQRWASNIKGTLFTKTYNVLHYLQKFSQFILKPKKHFDEEHDSMFKGNFIAGINTPEGIALYHIKLEYWYLFDIPEIDRAPKYDNYTPDDVMKRILSLSKSKRKKLQKNT